MSKTLTEIFAAAPVRPGRGDAVALGLIDVPERLRPIDPDWVTVLADSMATIGLNEPVVLRPVERDRYELVAGAHRLAAAKALGWAELPASIEVLDDLQARLVEIDENLIRRELSAIDRAVFLLERKRVWESMHPAARHGGDRKSRRVDQVANLATRFSAGAAERVGLSERLIQRAVAIAQALDPATIALVRSTYLADHGADLQKLARLRPDQQLFAVRAIAERRAKTLKDSLIALGRGPAPVDEQERLFQAFVAGWSRMNARTRRRVAAHITRGGKGDAEAAPQIPEEDA